MNKTMLIFAFLFVVMGLFVTSVYAVPSNGLTVEDIDVNPRRDAVLLFVDTYHKYDSCEKEIGYLVIYMKDTKDATVMCGSHNLTPDDVGMEMKVRFFE